MTPSGLVYRLRRPPEGWPDPPSMANAVETIILSLREENRRRNTSGEAILQGRTLDRWLFERQREAFDGVGVEMEKSSRWA